MPSSEMVQAVSESLSMMEMTLANAPTISGQLTKVWAAVLESAGLSPAEVRAACAKVIATERFFPQPAVFIAAARPPIDAATQAETAWLNVRRCLQDYGSAASLTAADFDGDTAALWAAARVGYEELGAVEDRERAFKRQEFLRYYAVAREAGHGLAHLAGRFERENRANAGVLRDRGLTLTPALCGRPDWSALPGEVTALPEEAITALVPVQSNGGLQRAALHPTPASQAPRSQP